MTSSAPSIAIIGGGVIGLACAWELSQRGAAVTIYDRHKTGLGSSWAAAGMLAPAFEAGAGNGAHPRLFDLCLTSAQQWSEYAAVLERASGIQLGYMHGPSFAIATDKTEAGALSDLHTHLQSYGQAAQLIDAADARAMEPALTGPLERALILPQDGYVDNRKLCDALAAACGKSGVRFVTGRRVERSDMPDADLTLWATGVDAELEGIVPVKGAAFALRPMSGLPQHVIRFGHHYIVPHKDRVVIGATVEPGKSDLTPDREAIGRLRAAAAEVCEAVEAGVIDMVWAGVRPGSPDHAPLIGAVSVNEYVAAGHYRNGILLAPITASIIADTVLGNKTSDLATAFRPDRFAAATA